MKRLFALLLALCLLLCACGGQAEETTEATEQATTETTEPTTEPTTEATTEPTEETTEATEAPIDPATVNPLTGEILDAPSDARPFALMINNSKDALPHCGTGEADVVYETCVEGGMTRFMAIFTDPASVPTIGSIRSARPPYIGFVQSVDAIYSSAGAAQNVLNMISSAGVDYINGLYYDGSYFYRDSARLNAGYDLEHTMFIKGENILKLAQEQGLRTTRKEDQVYGFVFDDEAVPSGQSANTVTISFTSGGKTTTCSYDTEKDGYTLVQYGIDYIDGNTNEQILFSNVLVLEASRSILSNGIHVQMETVGEGPGYLCRDGQMIPITWSRESETAPYVYKTAEGTDVLFATGSTYIAVIADGAPVQFQ